MENPWEIDQWNRSNYIFKFIKSMREDLWIKSSSLTENNFRIRMPGNQK
jgi:hypothetical protein